MPPVLPVDSFLPHIVEALKDHRAAVLVAAPGAGKTTRVPPALIDPGRVLLLQPRRVAARAMARRIAEERGWTIGREIGWHIRFERQFTGGTRLLVVTEGILTAYLQQDPLLSDVATIVIDEFHERSVHADLGLALARQAWLARSDLRIVVMSATLDPEPVSAFLGGIAFGVFLLAASPLLARSRIAGRCSTGQVVTHSGRSSPAGSMPVRIGSSRRLQRANVPWRAGCLAMSTKQQRGPR